MRKMILVIILLMMCVGCTKSVEQQTEVDVKNSSNGMVETVSTDEKIEIDEEEESSDQSSDLSSNEDSKINEGQSNVDFHGDIEGVYKYTYEHNTDDLIEDHYMIIEKVDGHMVGRYYGTSDEFDEAREGYLPGFFVLDMLDLKIAKDNIEFRLKLEDNQLFTHPIDLTTISSNDVLTALNPYWLNSGVTGENEYIGIIQNGSIILDIEGSTREFKHLAKNVENVEVVSTHSIQSNTILWILGNENWSIANIVGGSTESGWIDDELEVANALSGDEVYSVYDPLGLIGTYTGGHAIETGVMSQEVILHKDNNEINVFSDVNESKNGALIAVEGNWDAKPRVITQYDLEQTGVVKEILEAHGYTETDYIYQNLRYIYETDLDNDGYNELIVFESNIDLSNFHNESIEMSRYNKLNILSEKDLSNVSVINRTYKADEYWYLMYTGLNCLDLNGDGKMEVVAETEGMEESLLFVFTYLESEVIEVISCFYGV